MRIVIGFLVFIFCMPAVQANDKALQNALNKAQYMLRKATAEKAEVVRERDDLKKELATLKKEMEGKLAKQKKQGKKSDAKLAALREQYKDLRERFEGMALALQDQKNTGASLTQTLQNREANLKVCADNNQKLYDVNQELLVKYQEKGFWSVFKKKEPFTQLEKVAVENMIQDYDNQIEDLAYKEQADVVN